MKKTLLTILCTVLVCSCVMGVTLAYLMDSTAPIVNTFTIGNVDIDLTETGATNNAKEFKMVPGSTLDKDPTVTVATGSEDCWVFIKIDKANNFDTYMTYSMADGWTQLKDADNNDIAGVYYRSVGSADATRTFYVLSGGTDSKGSVTVKNTVTKEMADNLTTATYPTLTFTAYAVQSENVATAAAAWALVNP